MSSESAPSRKRARVEDGDGDRHSSLPTSGLQKDDDVWLSDGSIVVVAGDNIAFRVHKSTLARRSDIFRDLFSLPNADAATAETMDGCPIVHVSDSSDDLRHLFLVLCCGKNYYYDGDALIAVAFEVLASLIRMAHKYAVQDILDHALSRLKKFFTNDLAAWRDPESRARYVTMKDEHILTVVELARLTNTPSLLPTAFLLCTELLTSYWSREGVPLTLWISLLPVPDQVLLISAKGDLMDMCAERILRLLATVPCAGCTAPAACRVAREAPLYAIRNRNAFPDPPHYDRDILKPMAATLWDDPHRRMFCGSCHEALKEADEAESKWVWSCLPGVFGVKLDRDSWPGGSVDGTVGT